MHDCAAHICFFFFFARWSIRVHSFAIHVVELLFTIQWKVIFIYKSCVRPTYERPTDRHISLHRQCEIAMKELSSNKWQRQPGSAAAAKKISVPTRDVSPILIHVRFTHEKPKNKKLILLSSSPPPPPPLHSLLIPFLFLFFVRSIVFHSNVYDLFRLVFCACVRAHTHWHTILRFNFIWMVR